MKALVTGAYGFIGHHVVHALLEDAAEVRAMHLPNEPLDNLAGADVEAFAGDIRHPGSVAKAMNGCDRVFHLAGLYAMWAQRRRTFWEINVDGSSNVFRAAANAGVSKVVYTSTVAVTGGQGLDADATETTPFCLAEAGDPYSATKYAAHRVAEAYAAMGLDLTIVSPTGPIGPGDVGPTPTGQLLLMSVRNRVTAVVETVANLGDVRDIARGHLLAAEKGRRGESYLLGAENIQLRDLARMAQEIAYGAGRPIIKLPLPLIRIAALGAVFAADRITKKAPLLTPGAVRSSELGGRADCSKAKKELGLATRPLKESVRDALVWWARRDGYIKNQRMRDRILERELE